MRNLPNIVLLLLALSGPTKGQESPRVRFFPALYGLSYLRNQPDSAANSPKLIGSLPVLAGNFYGEVRYNYDADRTVGLYGGRVFSFGNRLSHSLTAQIGLLLGNFRGISAQVYYQLATPGFELNAQQQVSAGGQRSNRPFYYTWSDVQWKAGRHLRAGASVQAYRAATGSYTDGGLLVGYKMPRLCITLYHFNAYRPGQSYALIAVQYELSGNRWRTPRP